MQKLLKFDHFIQITLSFYPSIISQDQHFCTQKTENVSMFQVRMHVTT